VVRVEPSLMDTALLESVVVAEASQRRSLMPPSPVRPVLLSRSADVAGWARARLAGDFDPVPEQVVTVRKTRHGVRPVAELFLRDQLLYRALVASWGNRLPTPPRSSETYDAFEAAPLTDPNAAYVVSSDIAAFYQFIDYDLLTRELIAHTGDSSNVDTLVELLTNVTGRRFGIPQQSAPSDVLAEAYIDVLERRLIRANVSVFRYSDDFRITAASWSDALAAVDLLEREARRLGLALNDSKTVIRKRDTYSTSVARREQIRNEIAEEAELDLTGIDFDSPYGPTIIEPDQDDVRMHAFLKILQRWRVNSDDGAHQHALVQLLPTALSNLGLSPGTDKEIVETCMGILRTEQSLTPSVAQYLERVASANEPVVLAALDGLLATNPYLTPWQASWLAPALSQMPALASGSAGVQRAAWLRSVWDDGRAPEPVRAAIAPTLARHKIATVEELLNAYDVMSETSRPALAAALGTTGLDPTSARARALTDEDDLIRWQFEWGASQP
jgi:RNA-directed DNA polymerase